MQIMSMQETRAGALHEELEFQVFDFDIALQMASL